MNQFEFNFDESPEERLLRVRAAYLAKVGVPARTNDADEIEAALENPEAEKARLAALDREDDKDDIRRTYQR